MQLGLRITGLVQMIIISVYIIQQDGRLVKNKTISFVDMRPGLNRLLSKNKDTNRLIVKKGSYAFFTIDRSSAETHKKNAIACGGLESWKVGKLESWKVGKLESWKVGKLESWKVGKTKPYPKSS